jgi:hypothetical protein
MSSKTEFKAWERVKHLIGRNVEITQVSGPLITGILDSIRFEPIFKILVVENRDGFYILNFDHIVRIMQRKVTQE